MGVNIVDGILVAIVAASMFYGWKAGVLRLLVAVTAAMVGFIAARELYVPIAEVFSLAASFRPPNIFDGLSYLWIWCLATVGWTWAIRKIYPHTKLYDAEVGGWLWSIDHFGGLALGAVLGVLLAVALVGVAEMIVYYRWPGFVPSGGRDLVHIGFRDAALVNWMFTQAPGLAEFMGHWVPGVALAQEGRPQT
jgi:uncharacterized membrane protein required for colicin V production